MTGIVFKILADKFWVMANGNQYICTAKGTLKYNGILVGDKVIFSENENNIIEVLTRKNSLIRPPLANLDKLIIVISSVPEPDFMIVDKLILFSLSYGIEPVLVVNKIDISKEVRKKEKKHE